MKSNRPDLDSRKGVRIAHQYDQTTPRLRPTHPKILAAVPRDHPARTHPQRHDRLASFRRFSTEHVRMNSLTCRPQLRGGRLLYSPGKEFAANVVTRTASHVLTGVCGSHRHVLGGLTLPGFVGICRTHPTACRSPSDDRTTVNSQGHASPWWRAPNNKARRGRQKQTPRFEDGVVRPADPSSESTDAWN